MKLNDWEKLLVASRFETFGRHEIQTCKLMEDKHLLFSHAHLAKSLGLTLYLYAPKNTLLLRIIKAREQARVRLKLGQLGSSSTRQILIGLKFTKNLMNKFEQSSVNLV